jgi:hypothetical protein
MMTGHARMIYSNGDFYEGQFSEGQCFGFGTYKSYKTLGLEYSGMWKYNCAHGYGIETNKD